VRFLFGDYTLDVQRRELKCGAELVQVAPQVLDLLEFLIRRRDRVVSKDDLIEGVWGGRIVSESTLNSQINAARKVIGDNGEQQRLIRTMPRKGLRFVGEVVEAVASDAQASVSRPAMPRACPVPAESGDALDSLSGACSCRPTSPHFAGTCASVDATPGPALPDKPSIAVLPFLNLSDDPKQDYFADGIVEDIITALCRIRWLFVIASHSSFAYKGRACDVRQVGRELGVRYVLEGSVRKASQQIRITAQLVDAATGAHHWADQFDGAVEDIFALQDRVTAHVVGAMSPKLEQAEIERAKRKPTDSLDAYDYYLRGLAHVHQIGRDATDEALRLFIRAIELDPGFASPHGVAAFCYVVRKINGWTTDHARDVAEAERLARRAANLGKDDAVALAFGGLALGYVAGDLEGAVALIDRALALNPNLATAWYASGTVRAFRGGEPDVAIEHLARAMRLSLLDPLMFSMQGVTAFAHVFAGRYDDAAAWAEKAFWMRPNVLATLRIVAISNAFAGRREEARRAVAQALELDPDMRISNLKERIGIFRRAEDYSKYVDGLRRAGLPE
jgi:TolB-like protein/DNA-binding winged helix-turn-helix (wHTH) protein